MLVECSNQVALVTGASRGIGQAIALEFARSGASVALTGRDSRALETTAAAVDAFGNGMSIHTIDLSHDDGTETLASEVLSKWKQVDILVNNAGIAVAESAFAYDSKTWEMVRRINLDASFSLSRILGAGMVERRQGAIVNISSIAAAVALLDPAVSYSTTKAALGGLTRSLAEAWAPFNVRVNAVAPAYIATDINAQARTDPTFVARVETRTPVGRFGTPEDVAHAVVFLASPLAQFITGQTLYVDGGWTST
ncbi:MAG: SDR family NAD(P)-dependent oxidoreductase [Chloroflexota bacterium]